MFRSGSLDAKYSGEKYDVILMSSVTEYFSGYNYMRKVVESCIDCIDGSGYIFFGDVFDLELKVSYKNAIYDFAEQHPGARGKKDFSRELFIPRKYWENLALDMPFIKNIKVSNKLGKIKNEINMFRYDVLVQVDKSYIKDITKTEKVKYQYALL